MAGFLVPSDEDAITNAPDIFGRDNDDDTSNGLAEGDFFTLQTRSSAKTYGRVLQEVTTGSDVGLQVEEPMAIAFRNGDEIAVIRPSNGDIIGEWIIKEPKDDGLLPINGYVTAGVLPGDLVVRKLSGEDDIAEVRYWLRPIVNAGSNNFELMRDDGVTAATVATNINSLDLIYLLDDDTEVLSVPAADLERIRAIRVVLVGQTDNLRTGRDNYSGVKSRSLDTIVKIRNAF